MAKSKTSSFWLTETVTLAAGTGTNQPAQGTIDLSAYVDVGDSQAISVSEVDFIFQDQNDAAGVIEGGIQDVFAADATIDAQITDLNRGVAIVRADDRSLVGSGVLYLDQTNNVVTAVSDIFPDVYGPSAMSDSRLVVNDQLYFTLASGTAVAANHNLMCTVRLKCRVVKISKQDWMAIAIQSTAADN